MAQKTLLRIVSEDKNKVPVPMGQVLVVEWGSKKSPGRRGFNIYSQGDLVSREEMRKGIIIPKGGSSPFTNRDRGRRSASRRVFNRDGIAVIERDRAADIKFARQQEEWLSQKGFRSAEIKKIINSARPGQVRDAVEWAISAKEQWRENDPGLGERATEVALGQAIKASLGDPDPKVTATAIKELTGVDAPKATSPRRFFRIIAGIRTVLEIGFPSVG